MNIYKHTNDMPIESLYSEISKLIGWDKVPVIIPSKEDLSILFEKAKEKNSDAFYQLLKINRFGEPSIITVKKGKKETHEVNSDELERLNLVNKYVKEVQDIFRK